MVGIFDDWRTGMEEYALANARIAPAPEWKQSLLLSDGTAGEASSNISISIKAIQVSDF